jgi:hypothetical protein
MLNQYSASTQLHVKKDVALAFSNSKIPHVSLQVGDTLRFVQS